MDIKTITIKQPYASAIILGLKDVENRTWTTTHRGTIAIHSARSINTDGHSKIQRISGIDLPDNLPLGQILGYIDILDITTDSDSPYAIHGNYHWILGNPRPLRHPIPMAGKLGLYTIHLGGTKRRPTL
jgi:ASCH domain